MTFPLPFSVLNCSEVVGLFARPRASAMLFNSVLCASMCAGNGTLNKAAGIDFKQLSLLAKINENQSGEVWSCCFYITVVLSVTDVHNNACYKVINLTPAYVLHSYTVYCGGSAGTLSQCFFLL